MILACFVLGLSMRNVAIALLPILGRRISAATVSAVAKTLDAAVAAFHRRLLKDIYTVLILDGVIMSRKIGAGALRRPVLLALGLRPDGKKEIIDYRLEMICVDGGAGLLAALPTVYPDIPVQRCWAHTIRNVLDKVAKADRTRVKRALLAVMNAANLREAHSTARRLADRWQDLYPKTVACLRDHLDELPTCFGYRTLEERKRVHTNNGCERALRPSVVFRKVTNGFRSAWGAGLFADVRSVIDTGRHHGLTPLQAIQTALEEHPLLQPA